MQRSVIALGVFLATAATDYCWAQYQMASAERRSVDGANASAAIVVIGGLTLLAIVASPWMIIPEAAGAWAGSYIAIQMKS
jgi:hypothetical protein